MACRDAGGAMERDQMSRLVIGLGFREAATAQSIAEVLESVTARIAQPGSTTVLAVPEDKAAHPGLLAAALVSHYQIEMVATDAMREADARVITRSARVLRQ